MSVYIILKRGKNRIFFCGNDQMDVMELKMLVNQLWGEDIPSIYLFDVEGRRMENETTIAEHGISANNASSTFPYVIDVCLLRDYEAMMREDARSSAMFNNDSPALRKGETLATIFGLFCHKGKGVTDHSYVNPTNQAGMIHIWAIL